MCLLFSISMAWCSLIFDHIAFKIITGVIASIITLSAWVSVAFKLNNRETPKTPGIDEQVIIALIPCSKYHIQIRNYVANEDILTAIAVYICAYVGYLSCIFEAHPNNTVQSTTLVTNTTGSLNSFPTQ